MKTPRVRRLAGRLALAVFRGACGSAVGLMLVATVPPSDAATAGAAPAEPPAKKEPAPAPTPKPSPAKGPVNSKCPVSGEPIDANVTLEYEGKLVAFCCEACRDEFKATPAKFAEKLK